MRSRRLNAFSVVFIVSVWTGKAIWKRSCGRNTFIAFSVKWKRKLLRTRVDVAGQFGKDDVNLPDASKGCMGQAQSFPPIAAIQFQCHRHTTVIKKAAGKMSDSKQIALLKQFIDLCKNNASILHKPELSFFRDWLERWVCTVHVTRKHSPRKERKKYAEMFEKYLPW